MQPRRLKFKSQRHIDTKTASTHGVVRTTLRHHGVDAVAASHIDSREDLAQGRAVYDHLNPDTQHIKEPQHA